MAQHWLPQSTAHSDMSTFAILGRWQQSYRTIQEIAFPCIIIALNSTCTPHLLCDRREVGTVSTFPLAMFLRITPLHKLEGKWEVTRRSELVPAVWTGFNMVWRSLYWHTCHMKSYKNIVHVISSVWTNRRLCFSFTHKINSSSRPIDTYMQQWTMPSLGRRLLIHAEIKSLYVSVTAIRASNVSHFIKPMLPANTYS